MTPLLERGALKLLDTYLWFRFRCSFHSLQFHTSQIESQLKLDKPVLFIANHSTWWDGFFVFELYKRLRLKKPFRIVMLESELKKFPFFRLCGAVGLIPKNSDHNNQVLKSLQNSCVSFFPQGQLLPQGHRPLVFKPGLLRLINLMGPVQIITVGLHIEPFQNQRPTALIKAGHLLRSHEASFTLESLAELVERNLDEVTHKWTEKIFEARVNPWNL